jgi:hypothetical protein
MIDLQLLALGAAVLLLLQLVAAVEARTRAASSAPLRPGGGATASPRDRRAGVRPGRRGRIRGRTRARLTQASRTAPTRRGGRRVAVPAPDGRGGRVRAAGVGAPAPAARPG